MTMQALSDVLEERGRCRLWQDYAASMLWVEARSQYREFPFPTWIELTAKPEPQDRRTAEEIRDDLIARLNKEVNP